jgi:NTE family protein
MSARFNLVLSGGGVRGYAHVGAIKALVGMGVQIAAISGGSCGAIVGALICDGYSPEEVEEIIIREQPKIGVNLRGLRSGLLTFSGVRGLLKKYIRAATFEELKIPLFVATTDLITGKQKVFSSGDLLLPLCASSAIPMLLEPVEIDGVPYADAGMSNNLPVEPLTGTHEKIIGIHVNPVPPYRKHRGLLETIDRSMHIIVGNNTRSAISMCDIFIEPSELVNYHILQWKKTEEIIQAGFNHVKATIQPSMLI